MNPRANPQCPKCPGEFEYKGQEVNPKGSIVSVYECNNCGNQEFAQ